MRISSHVKAIDGMQKFFLLMTWIVLMGPFSSTYAYNWPWDQGHDCVTGIPGKDGWSRYGYDGNPVKGDYSTKECCDTYCKMCPVYANTGRYQFSTTDLSVPGVGPRLAVTRTYDSQEWSSSLMGYGWIFNFGKRLIISRNRLGQKVIIVRLETGEQNYYTEDSDGLLTRHTGYGGSYQLTKNNDGTYSLLNNDGSNMHLRADGKIIRFTDKNSNALLFEYDANGCLIRITNASGNYIDLQLGPNGKIASVTDNLGRTVAYEYNNNGNLTVVVDPLGYKTQYAYNSNKQLNQIKDGNDNIVDVITYDDHQPPRVATFLEAAERYSITYFDGRTEKSDSQGNTWTYYYNDLGVIKKVVDPLGNTKNQQLNKMTSTSVDWEEDLNGNRTTFTYDAIGNIKSETDSLGASWSYSYLEGSHLKSSETDPSGMVKNFNYDNRGNLIEIISDVGGSLEKVVSYVYDDQGNLIKEINSNGQTTSYSYDALGNLLQKTDPLGASTRYTYDPRGNTLSVSDSQNNTSAFAYDLMGRLLSRVDELGNTESYQYDANGNRTTIVDELGRTSTNSYDAQNRLVSLVDPLGNTTLYSYDSRGNQTSITDANGQKTSYEFNILNQLIRETDALGGQTNFTYDAMGNLLSVVDARGNTTQYRYDANNRRVSETSANGDTITYTYDAVGNLIVVTLPNANTITRIFDQLGRLLTISDSIGVIKRYQYDLAGNIIEESDAVGGVRKFEYDAGNRLIQDTDPEGNITQFKYNSRGHLIEKIDAVGNIQQFTYDALGRNVSTSDSLGNTTSYTFNSVGNLMSRVDANGNTNNYVYDANDRLVKEIYADSTTKLISYDVLGNKVSVTDQNGVTTNFKYDALNRRVRTEYATMADAFYSYDAVGNLVSASNSHSTVNLSYDNINRVIQSTQNGETVSYSFDTSLRTRQVIYPSAKVLNEKSNLRNLLSRVEDASGQALVQYGYDVVNQVQSKSYLNGVNAVYSYDLNRRIENINYQIGTLQLVGFQYAYDSLGNSLFSKSSHSPDNSEQYRYDANSRIIELRRGTLNTANTITSPSKQTTFTLDALSNWTAKSSNNVTETRLHNNVNELVQRDNISLIYDHNGNMIENVAYTYEYDDRNHLIKVVDKTNNGTVGEYQYDALGRRIEKQAFGVTTHYYYDGNRVIEEHTSTSTVTYVYGVAIDEVISVDQESQTYYYHNNALGSVVAITNASGDVIERYRYDAYGKPSFYDAADSLITESTIDNPYLFTARRYDKESGLQYNRNRYYAYDLGRWVTRDPVAYVDSMNQYEYVLSNPIIGTDVFGLWTVKGVLKILCCTTDGKKVVKELAKMNIVKFTKAFDKWRYADGSIREDDLSRRLRGNTRRTTPTTIRVNAALSDKSAVSTLYHEAGHARRPRSTTRAESLQQEIDVRVETEEYKIKVGLPETKAGYRNPDGTVNRKFIEDQINNSSHYNPTGRTRIGRRYEGETSVGGWVCP